ncbi:chromosome segregation protein SMC, partial [Halomonas litopenaei]|nr:chromosome segregation protein SMC [Halomonas litopenaei]
GRIDQLTRDMERESGLNKDAGETIARLEWEAREIEKAGEGHEGRLKDAQDAAREAAGVLQQREADLSQLTEDVARLAARHQSAQRLLDDNRTTLRKHEDEAARAKAAMKEAETALAKAEADFAAAGEAETASVAAAEAADVALNDAESARAATQARESDARALRSEAE